MDFGMDMESEDDVQCFLAAKLEQMRLQNEVMQAVLEKQKKALLGKTPSYNQRVWIENIWQRNLNDKFAIGFDMLSFAFFENIRVVLICDDIGKYMRYKVKTYKVTPENNQQCTAGKNCNETICGLIKKADAFQTHAHVTISFKVPEFMDRFKYAISGYVICFIDGEDIRYPLPDIQLVLKDTIFQNGWMVETQSLPSLFTMISCGNMIDLVICLPEEWTTPLANTFETNCSLTQVPVLGKTYFIAYQISKLFDNTLVIIHPHEFKQGTENDIFLKVYTSCDEQLFAFLHHLLICIPNSIIFPSMFYQSILMCRKSSYKLERKNKLLEDFEKGMRADIHHSYYYARMANGCQTYIAENRSYRFNQHRQKLSEQESETDFRYIEVLKI